MLLYFYTSLIDDPDYIELFEMIYNKYRLVLIHDAYLIIKDQDYAQDIVHDAFIRFAKNIDRLDFRNNPLPILRTVTRNCALNFYHKIKNEQIMSDCDDDLLIPDSFDFTRELETKDAFEVVADFVEAMPYGYADVFTLRYVHDLSCIQIASLLELKSSTVRKRLQRIRDAVTDNFPKELLYE